MAGSARENPEDWLYEFEWQPRERRDEQPASETSALDSRSSWLIFADSSGVGEELGALIKARGARSILVTRGESYERTDGDHFRIHPERPEDVRQLLDAVIAPDQPTCRAIVHLWTLDAAPPEETTVTSLETAQTLGCDSILQLVKELARVERYHFPRLWMITRGAQPAGEETLPLNTAQAPLWGLGRVVAQEHPMFWGGLMDLEPRASLLEDVARQLWKEISVANGEDQIAFREGRRYVGRLVRKRRSDSFEAPLKWRTDGSYLVTGGLGDLGLAVARWMVEQGARRLILMGRSQLPPRSQWNSAQPGSRLAHQIAAIREIEALGASVHLAAVDVAEEVQLSTFLDRFRAEGWPPIRGVVHAAGVLHDGLLVQLDAAALNSVLQPKMIGGWLLHRLLEDAPLDFLCTILLGRFHTRPTWPGELCCRERLSGCSGSSPTSAGTARPQHQLGSVERIGLRRFARRTAPGRAARAFGNQEHQTRSGTGSSGTTAPARLDPGRSGAG